CTATFTIIVSTFHDQKWIFFLKATIRQKRHCNSHSFQLRSRCMSDLEGAMLSEYLLLKCINKGGTADVYRARQQSGGNYEVAVKVFRPGYAQRKSFRDYFMTEADKIGQLDHPNILPFLEFGEGEGLLYTVTPLVPTGTLTDLLERVGGKLSAMQALPIMQQ